MAEGKAGGAAGLFAKQVQKKFSRAQEKVGPDLAARPSPRWQGAKARGRRWREGPEGAQAGGWTKGKGEGLPCPQGDGRWGVDVHGNRQT